MDIKVREASIAEVVSLSQLIPEFDNPYPESEYQSRMDGKASLILIAEIDNQPAGFKVGYDKYNDRSFYSWMGAVLPAFRKSGVALKLAQHQEEWARKSGYRCIRFKTRNYLKTMLIFALKNGFHITEVLPWPDVKDNRIVLEKLL
ncbi:MAG: GNAT family N-acetyltransferase [Bacteroidota bacterium]